MSKYSEMFSSFQRQGAFPFEANYIFPTEAALKEFYNNEINKATLHKGLLRIVENDEDQKQALYWVVQDKTTGELKFTKLAIEVENIYEGLSGLEEKLNKEISDRQTGDQAIWGTSDASLIPEDLNSIIDLSVAVTNLKTKLQNLIDDLESVDYNPIKLDIKAIVGTEEDNIIEYLKTLDYGDLTTISNLLNKFLNEVDESSEYIGTFKELQNFLDGFKDSDRLRTILDELEDKIVPLATWVKNRTDNLQTELDQTQVGVGLSGDGSFQPDEETNYLTPATSVMHALRILDHYIKQTVTDMQDIYDMMGQPNGLATLDEHGQVPKDQLPEWVKDIQNVYAIYEIDDIGRLYNIQLYTNVELTEIATPDPERIFQDIKMGVDGSQPSFQFRWDGMKWVQVHQGCLILGEIDDTAYEGSKGKDVTDRMNRLTDNDINVISEIENTPNANEVEIQLTFENYNIAQSGEISHSTDTVQTTLPAATDSTAGIMSAIDKKNLDRIISDTYPLTISSFTNNLNLKEVGSTADGVFTWTYKNLDFHPVQSHKINNTNISDLEARTYTINGITSSTHQTLNYTLTVTSTDGKTASKTTSVQFNHATYVGAVKDFSLAELSKLAKSIEYGKNCTKQVVQDDSKLVYCYPSYFGDLTSIKNSSGFEGITGYDKTQIMVGSQQYIAYIQKIAATATDTYTFK